MDTERCSRRRAHQPDELKNELNELSSLLWLPRSTQIHPRQVSSVIKSETSRLGEICPVSPIWSFGLLAHRLGYQAGPGPLPLRKQASLSLGPFPWSFLSPSPLRLNPRPPRAREPTAAPPPPPPPHSRRASYRRPGRRFSRQRYCFCHPLSRSPSPHHEPALAEPRSSPHGVLSMRLSALGMVPGRGVFHLAAYPRHLTERPPSLTSAPLGAVTGFGRKTERLSCLP